MKSVRQIIRDMVDKYPNDMELGARVRWYIKWLYEGKKDAEEKSNSSKWSAQLWVDWENGMQSKRKNKPLHNKI